MTQRFEYGTAHIKDFRVRTAVDKHGKAHTPEVLLNGEPLEPSKRFWTSLHVRFGFTGNIFKYFSHEEVFNRISEVAACDQVRWCVERRGDGTGKLLAVAGPTGGFIRHDDLLALLDRYGPEEVRYHDGVVRSRHAPRHGGTFDVAGDGFQNRFVLDTPIDGFGRPNVYLSLLRLRCSNGAVGYTPTFRSELGVGKGDEGVAFALVRVLDGFNNEEGFAALRQRFESAAKSWASVNEVNRLHKTLGRMHHRGEVQGRLRRAGGDGAEEVPVGSPLFRAFHDMTGNLPEVYGLANLDALSGKRQRTLPACCKVYDLLNFASEVATHHATPAGNMTLQAYIGDLVAGEYDLEGTVDQFSDWRDFFIGSESAAGTLADLNKRGRR
ncbi:MAG TPA: hypothetical protein VFA26_11215 [Gemmataceae bacterium]|nr:hypothetical protein [Gemmataceae bacterium]